MEVKPQNIVHGSSDGTQDIVTGGGIVLPSDSQIEISNYILIHWYRASYDLKHLQIVKEFLTYLMGKPETDGFGLWSYESRYIWSNGASLNFDVDLGRALNVHKNRITLDIPGQACDELCRYGIQFLFEFTAKLDGKCTRIDTAFDDYKRTVSYDELLDVAMRGDYSGLRDFQNRTAYKRTKDGMEVTRREISFGKRGQCGNGKYIRWYDKELESGGELKCDRLEIEWTGEKAHKVFTKLAETGLDTNAWAVVCGAVIAGAITFVKRNGDKNINRLEEYSWWKQIKTFLGDGIKIRTERKKDSLTGKFNYVEKYVASSLACIKSVFVSKWDFLRWLYDVCDDGDNRMNEHTRQIKQEYGETMIYRWKDAQAGAKNYELSKL